MKQIIAIGSGGMDDNPSIELYILAQSNKKNPKVLFLATPAGDDGGYINFFTKYFERFPCKPSHLSLFSPPTKDLESVVMENDIVFVSGGHSRNALVLWKSWGMDKILQKAYNNNVILSGGSAGSVVWFDECITDSVPGKLTVMPCLGILPYSNCPHYTSKHRQETYEKEMLRYNIKSGYAIDDDAALHFIDGKPVRGVSIRDQSKSFYCHTDNGNWCFVQDEIETRNLKDKTVMEELVWGSKTFSHLV